MAWNAPGMPFSGYPVFRTQPGRGPLPGHDTPHRLPRPSRAFTKLTPARRPALHPDSRRSSTLPTQQPTSVSRSSTHKGSSYPQRRRQPPPEPAGRFYTLGEPCHENALRRERPGPSLAPDRVCFAPATLLSFHLQGFGPPGDRNRVSATPSSHAVTTRTLTDRSASKG